MKQSFNDMEEGRIVVPRENRAQINNEAIAKYEQSLRAEIIAERQKPKDGTMDIEEVIKKMANRANIENKRNPIFQNIDQAKKAYWLALMINARGRQNLRTNKHQVKFMSYFATYFANIEGEYKCDLGIALSGASGIGKTFLFEAAQVMSKTTKNNDFQIYSAKEINRQIANDSRKYDKFLNGEILIDDLGIEELSVVNYGTKSSPVSDVIFDRERLWHNKGIRTHFTTNLTYDECEARYGDRIMNRVRRMVNWSEINL